MFVQAELGRCGFLDVLEEAATRRYVVTLGLSDGTEISGMVVNVVTADGADWAVLADRPRVDTRSIVWLQHVPRDPVAAASSDPEAP